MDSLTACQRSDEDALADAAHAVDAGLGLNAGNADGLARRVEDMLLERREVVRARQEMQRKFWDVVKVSNL